MAAKKNESRTAKEGFVLLAAPADVTAATALGVEYQVIGGVIEVPETGAADLAPHGFTPLPTLE